MKQKLSSVKLILFVLLLASGVAIDLVTQRGLSTNCLTLMMGLGSAYGFFNVAVKGVTAYREKSALQVQHVQVLLSQVDQTLKDVNAAQNHLIQNVSLTNQALARLIGENQNGHTDAE